LSHEIRRDTLRDTLEHGVRGLARSLLGHSRNLATEEFWALKDVSFEVKQGSAVGIIGRNGAGKSTLLKILSRITEPTSGIIRLRGRVASLLEVGTGFHPELSGRENIFLNGAILGMSRAEIRRKFDEIVAFAEVERFLDTPVKYYSSGMYVRLAFGVAAHLEPEILIVDEVLAVGDAVFQKKCLGKMKSVSQTEGRTVLFVSHNLGAIEALCTSCVVLAQGRKVYDGPTVDAVSAYLTGLDTPVSDPLMEKTLGIRIDSCRVSHEEDSTLLVVDITVRVNELLYASVELHLLSGGGQPLCFGDGGTLVPARAITLPPGEHLMTWEMDVSNLANGRYQLAAQLMEPRVRLLSRHEYSTTIDFVRMPRGGATQVLTQSWQSGFVELPMRRIR